MITAVSVKYVIICHDTCNDTSSFKFIREVNMPINGTCCLSKDPPDIENLLSLNPKVYCRASVVPSAQTKINKRLWKRNSDKKCAEDETDQAIEEPDEIMHINRDSESKYDKSDRHETFELNCNFQMLPKELYQEN
ncbi:hypothetical protein TNCV_4407931 [Trichonephila clavipes]|nr:hypothetical protein TNCV_4407931 [Trichonephila clavipes]